MSTNLNLQKYYPQSPFVLAPHELVTKEPRCYWFDVGQRPGQKSPSGQMVGFDLAGWVYLARSLYPSEHPEIPYESFAWMANQDWLIIRSRESDAARDYFNSRWPDFLDRTLAASLLNLSHDQMKALPHPATGRYVMEWQRDVSTNPVQTLWTCMAFEISPDAVQFTPDVKLLAANGENVFTGHPFQIWSDGVITRFDCRDEPEYAVPKDVLDLLKYAVRQNEWTAQQKWQRLLQVQITGREQLAKREFGGPGNYQGYMLYRISTTTAPLFLVEEEWGYLGEDGDAGDSALLFDDERAARTEYERQISAFTGGRKASQQTRYDPALGEIRVENEDV